MDEQRAAAMKEAYDRGILPDDKKAAYEEAVRRGLLSGAQPAAPERSTGEEVAGAVPRGIFKATLGSLASFARGAQIEDEQRAMAFDIPGAKPLPEIPTGEAAMKTFGQATGLELPPPPKSFVGRAAESGVEALANPLTYFGPGGLALKAGGGVLSAVGGEAAGQVAETFGAGQGGQTMAQIGGSVLTGLGTGAASMARQEAKLSSRLPTRIDHKKEADRGFEQLRKSDAQISPEGTTVLGKEILAHLEETNHARYNTEHAPVFAAVDDLMGIGRAAERAEQATARRGEAAVGALSSESTPAEVAAATRAQGATAGVTTSVAEINRVRGILTNMAGTSVSPATRQAAGRAIDAIDNFLINIPDHFVISGNPRADAELLRRSNQLWSVYRQMETIEKASTKIQRRTQSTGTGFNRINVSRQEIGKILDSEKKSRGMPQAVKDKIEEIANGTHATNAARYASKYAPGGPVSAMISVATGYGAGWKAGATMAVTGLIAKYAGEYLTDRQIRQLTDMIRGGSALGQPIQREISPLMERAQFTPAAQAARALATGPLATGPSP